MRMKDKKTTAVIELLKLIQFHTQLNQIALIAEVFHGY